MSPIRIVQITDTHIMAQGADWYGRKETNTHGRLQEVIDHVNALDPQPDVVIHTGDITEKGDVPAYEHAKNLLKKLKAPYYVTCGNHDGFEHLKSVFTDQHFASERFAHHDLNLLPVRLLVMDSHIPGKDEGVLCDERKDWLVSRLKEDGKKPTLIFMHHFPLTLDSALFATINLQKASELGNILADYPQVKGLYCGHYHHASAGFFGKTFCWVSASTAPSHIVEGGHCVGLNLTPPSYSLHLVKDEEISSKIVTVAPVLKMGNNH